MSWVGHVDSNMKYSYKVLASNMCKKMFWIFRVSMDKTAVAQWLRYCAGSIPDGISGFFIDIKSFRSHYSPNRNEYQEYFLGVKAAGA